MLIAELLQLNEGKKQKASLKFKRHMADRAEINDHFDTHNWPKSLLGTPVEILRVGDDVHLKTDDEVGTIAKIDGRNITIKFSDVEKIVDITKILPSFVSNI